MARYIGQRLIQLFIVLFVVTFLVAIALRFLPGGADVVVALKTGPGATPEQAAEIKHELYLDRSIPEQYALWLKDLVTLDWGTTFQTNQPIREELGRAFPVSIRLMIYAQLLALGFAIPMGMWSAYKQGTGVDRGDNNGVVRPSGHARVHRGSAAHLPVRPAFPMVRLPGVEHQLLRRSTRPLQGLRAAHAHHRAPALRHVHAAPARRTWSPPSRATSSPRRGPRA